MNKQQSKILQAEMQMSCWFFTVRLGTFLRPIVPMENEGLAWVWNSPMAGFFAYVEFGKA